MSTLQEKLQHALMECARLKQENQQLKEELEHYKPQLVNTFAPIQSNETVTQYKNQQITHRLQIFKNLFNGRTDVYAVHWESKQGKSAYTPACAHEWQPPICQKPEIKCSNCQHRKLLHLTDQVIYDHLIGKHVIGLYPLLHDDTCWFLAVDFDKKNWQRDIQAFANSCKEFNIPASIERSRSGNGGHVWIFFARPIPASLARKLGNALLTNTLSKRFEVGMDSYDRLFPNQDTLPKGGFGNLIALPLQRNARNNGNSVFVDENFTPYPNQWIYLENVQKMKMEDVEKAIHACYKNDNQSILLKEVHNTQQSDFPSTIKIIEKNGLYIEKATLNSMLALKIIQLATFKNQEYYKAQAKRLSTYGIPKNISSYDETDRFIRLPRGCKLPLITLLNEHSIDYEFQIDTNLGQGITATFNATLTPTQETALQKLLEQDIGILSATTGFGKTVIAAALIARRNVNTLILVHRKQLIEQWKERLSTFLTLENGFIGQIGGGKNKPSGIIDVATIQSLNYQGEVKEQVARYGQIIVDECHHISAFSFEKVLKKAEAKFVCGLTATPTRKDGLQPIMTMQLGPIRHQVSAKSQVNVRPFEHILIPRPTNFISSHKVENKNVQTIYKSLINDEARNRMIFDDVLTELNKGAVPLILTERVEHVHYLESKFNGFVKNIIVLTGGMTKKEEIEKRKSLAEMPENEERLIIATGKYIGEGFDYDRLDTLFLVMPISWKGTLQQYVGRLHRLHNQKSAVKVFDYVDSKEPILQAMFDKRIKSYHSMGYKLSNQVSTTVDATQQMKLF